MSEQIIIGFSGRARHGKTECTMAIKEYAEKCECRTVGIYDVGAMILQMCIKQNRLPQVNRVDMTKEQLQVLIDVGKEMRKVDENYWVNRVVEQALEDKFDVAMCPNLRMPQECAAIRNVGGYVVRVNSLNADGSMYISPDRDPNDPTETALQFWAADFYLTVVDPPDATLLKAQAVTLYKYIRGRHQC
jgi:hypothetical protein